MEEIALSVVRVIESSTGMFLWLPVSYICVDAGKASHYTLKNH